LFAVIALLLVWDNERLWQSLPSVRAALARVRFTSPLVRLAICLVAGAFFYLFRIRYMGWGDAALLVKALADPYRITYVWQAPLDVFLHAKAWQLGTLFGCRSVPVYHIQRIRRHGIRLVSHQPRDSIGPLRTNAHIVRLV
jgi:hypothetical protein